MFSTAKLALTFAILSLIGTGIFKFHFEPISELKHEIQRYKTAKAQTDIMLRDIGDEMNIAFSRLGTCESNLTTQYNQGYIDGIAEEQEYNAITAEQGGNYENSVISLDNLHT